VTVNNFIVLALDGYYDGMPWKTEDWVVQSGDPNGDGTGGPGYTLPEEPNTAPDWGIGAVGMARPIGAPINGSQFFIERAAWPGSGPTAVYNRFGTVIKGMDKAEVLTGPSDRITSITIQVG
jgi:cyclophilin family peptidyl-prolyl cis-trans isomerase